MWKTIVTILVALSSELMAAKVKERWYPWYHLAPPYGWMNDPNGFSLFNGEIHLFYQFNPYSSQEPGTAHWGHAKSKDYFNWEHLPIAMYPDQCYDKDGVFSGSALIENGEMYIFYTGDVIYGNETNSHINVQALSSSTNAINFTKYAENPIIMGDDFQPNFRDPKVWKHDDKYYMVLGNSYDNSTKGRVLLFTAENKTSWSFSSVLDQSDGSFGYMWECPDLFQLNDTWVLMYSPQGVKPQGDNFRNLYQTGYRLGSFSYETKQFTPIDKFIEIDRGTDFYATQTYYDEVRNQRILVAWFDMWERDYLERDDGFTGQMTIPRRLTISSDGKLLQWPVDDIEVAKDTVLRTGKATSEDSLTLENNAAEIKIEASVSKDFVLYIQSNTSTVAISYSFTNKTVIVDRGGNDGFRRAPWKPDSKLEWLIYLDLSSVELFCGKGELTFSTRYFPGNNVTIRLGTDSEADEMHITSMKRTMPRSA